MKKKLMNKYVSTILSLCMIFIFAIGCGKSNVSPQDSAQKDAAPQDSATIRIAALKGPTSMGLVKLVEDKKVKVDFKMYNAADEIVPLLVKGEIDMASIPANLASVLYAKTKGNVVALNINTLGVLYGVAADKNIKTIKDLEGKTVFMTGKGTVPEHSLRYLLEKNNVDSQKVKIEFKSEPAEVVAALKTNAVAVGILPQPFTTVALNSNDKLNIVLNLSENWEDTAKGESSMVTAVTVVRKEFLNAHKELVKSFLNEQQASVKYTKDHGKEAATLIEKYDIVKSAIAEKALPYCNLVCITGDEMSKKLSGYLTTLYNADKSSVGGNLPGDDFYYKEK